MANRSRLGSSTVRASAVSDFDLYCEEAPVTLVGRFLSKDRIPRILDHSGKNQKLFLTCCLILPWKLRNEAFKVAKFLENKLEFSGGDLVAMAKRICRSRILEKRFPKTVMPFRFIDFLASFITLPPSALCPVYKLLVKSQVRILRNTRSMKTVAFFYFFSMFVDFPRPPSRSSMLCLSKVLLRSEYDVAFTLFSESIRVACAMLIFISKEFPDQLNDFETNVIKGYFHPGLQGTIKKCLKKLVPLYRDMSSSTSDPSSSSIDDQEGPGPSHRCRGKEPAAANPPPNATVGLGSTDIRYQIRSTSKSSSSSEEEANTTRSIMHSNWTGLPSFFNDVEFCCRNDAILHPYNQKMTDSCYAITVVTTMFADMCLNNRYEQACEASAQQLVDCLYRVDNTSLLAGPRGLPASLSDAFNYVKEHGLFSKQNCPWEFMCQAAPIIESFDHSQGLKIYINGMGTIDNSDHQAVIRQLRIQPIAGMLVACPSFLKVKEGIFPGATHEESIMTKMSVDNGNISTPFHAVTLIGYGGQVGVNDFYLCQNSYGKRFGMYGLFKIRRHAVGGFCWPFGTHKEIKGTNQPTRSDDHPDPMEIDWK